MAGPGSPLVVAALSARALAEAAAAEGRAVLALDLFGDVDTRRVAAGWWSIGDAARLQIEAGPLCDALRQARAFGATGWVAGSGFEADPTLLAAGDAVLPLVGNGAAVLRRTTRPEAFFGCLDAHGLPHPAVQWSRPADPADWLHKDSAGCGGWRVRPAAAVPPGEPLAATACWQRRAPGRPVSATFVADGRSAVVLGFNEQRVVALPGAPYAFAGIVGPLRLPAPAERVMRQALAVLVPSFGLRGLGSLDALLDGEALTLLELNPRPPASLSLYPPGGGRPGALGALGALGAHLQACGQGGLPPAPAPGGPVHGQAIVYAPRALVVDAALAAALARWPGAHDLPQPGTVLAAGDPLCSLSAGGDTAPRVHAALDRAVAQLQRLLNEPAPETCPP